MRSAFASLVIALGLLAVSQPAAADRRDDDRGSRRGLRLDTPFIEHGRDSRDSRDNDRRGGLTANEAARRAQAENGGGRVLSVDRRGDGYRVKLLRDGEVRVVQVE